ncbi:LytTR family transcriptional regulator DNA-binding domain-containing protein [Carboxylicivirga mesophila]|uniref:LytTR family transcriptional regulator DNA-binding domain-containing protein n=1 Tax=Carboxylicivirga mesophila TaxID=1166478 RepID=A0ABS5KB61_9BACT|nr:LytTR family transcriptional regulator DNA-binding domain-containing protein [Carboxylicivirga mesophila]MBS2211748.1 LytTR family transcriptional regulator DNA-binding domain-containing protein [Carboxylicivirga mesophila]
MPNTHLLNRPFNLLMPVRSRLFFVAFITIYLVLFLNIYKPYNLETWYVFSNNKQVFELGLLGLIGGLYFCFSQLLLPKLIKFRVSKVWHFALWTLAELALLTLLLTVLYDDIRSFWQFVAEFSSNLKYVGLTLLPPYSFSLILLSWYQKQQAINEFRQKSKHHKVANTLVQFTDENGKIKLSIQLSEILYLVSMDNYVEIYYQIEGEQVRKELIRNSLKNLEEPLQQLPIRRCHRSYMINTSKITIIKRLEKKQVAMLKGIQEPIPISKTYHSHFKSFL